MSELGAFLRDKLHRLRQRIQNASQRNITLSLQFYTLMGVDWNIAAVHNATVKGVLSTMANQKSGGGPGDTAAPPTLKTIAYMTGYSITAVSRALKDAPDISAEAKERVRLVARQVGYRPNRAGVRLRTGKTNVIALILNTEEEVMGLTAQLVHGISAALRDTSYHLVVTPYSYANDPMDPVRYVVETGSADGVILSRIERQDRRIRYLTEHGMPFATHGRCEMGIEHPWHDFDNERYAYEAVGRLAAMGARNLALVAPPDKLTYAMHMKTGFRERIDQLDLVEVPMDGVTVDDTLDTIQAYTVDVMRRRTRPDGIVCGSGTAAIAVSAGIEEAGLAVGRDVQIVSKQHTNILKRFRKDISVFNEDVKVAGRDLAHCIMKAIEGVPAKELQFLSYPNDDSAGAAIQSAGHLQAEHDAG